MKQQKPFKFFKYKVTTFLLATSLLQTGCITAGVWSEGVEKTTYTYEKTSNDRILAFGQVKTDSSQMKKDSLVLMGRDYWYVLSSQSSQQTFLPILRSKLPKPFTITPSGKFSEASAGTLPIVMRSDGKTFFSRFCLSYETKDQNEISTLQKLQFKPKNNSFQYARCFDPEGDIFATNKDAPPAEYQFQSNVPVSVMEIKSETNVSVGAVITKAAITPVTLAADAITAVVAVPAFILFAGVMANAH